MGQVEHCRVWIGAIDADESVNDLASTCGVMCISDPDLEACTAACINASSLGAVSTPCGRCYGVYFRCSVEMCLADCLADPAAPACMSCLEMAGCQRRPVLSGSTSTSMPSA